MKFFVITKFIVDIRVGDLDRAVAFYRDTLGLSLIRKESEWASFNAAGAEIHLYLHGGTREGCEFRVSDIEEAVALLTSRGVTFPHGIEIHAWGKLATFQDSEGNTLALVEDR